MSQYLLAERFEEHRGHLEAVALRLLGSKSEAEDAVQEGWIRLSRADADEIENLGGWLTTVVGRICLDMLRSRRARSEEAIDDELESGEEELIGGDPEAEVILAEEVGEAMATLLERLSPAERVSFVLHDLFDVTFDEVAAVIGRTPVAARQLASRGRRRLQGGTNDDGVTRKEGEGEIVEAFFRASRAGDIAGLLALLAPDVVLQPDDAALAMGSRNGWITSDIHGAEAVAQRFKGQAEGARLARIDGAPAGIWAPGGIPRVAFLFTIRGGRVVQIDLVANPERLREMRIEEVG